MEIRTKRVASLELLEGVNIFDREFNSSAHGLLPVYSSKASIMGFAIFLNTSSTSFGKVNWVRSCATCYVQVKRYGALFGTSEKKFEENMSEKFEGKVFEIMKINFRRHLAEI